MSINPALAELEPLVGRWRTELYNAAFLPDADTRARGSVEIDWIEDGSALRMCQGDSENPPAAVWIIGRDDSEPGYSVLYADDRGVSRVYRMSLEDAHWQMWRDTREFSQRFHAQLDPEARNDTRTLGEICRPRRDVGARLQHRLHPRTGVRPEPLVEATPPAASLLAGTLSISDRPGRARGRDPQGSTRSLALGEAEALAAPPFGPGPRPTRASGWQNFISQLAD